MEEAGGKAPGEGPAHPGRGLSHPVLGFPRPSRRRLWTLSRYCSKSAGLHPPPSCCIANKILMSPLPLPLGRLLRSARGAGSSASSAARTAPCAPALARAGTPPGCCRLGPTISAPGPPSSASPRSFSRVSGKVGEGRLREQRVGPCAAAPSRTLRSGGVAPPAAPGSPPGSPARFLPSALFPPPQLAPGPPPRLPFTLSAVYCLSPPPRLAFGLGISSLFITYFDPASLCPRFLRKFYCPRSRVFD